MRSDRKVTTIGLAALVLVVGAPLVVHAKPTPAQICAAAKAKAAAKKAAAKLKCYQTATVQGAAQVDAACLTAAETKFGAAIAKAEAAGGCAVTGDGGTIEAAVDAFVGAVHALTP